MGKRPEVMELVGYPESVVEVSIPAGGMVGLRMPGAGSGVGGRGIPCLVPGLTFLSGCTRVYRGWLNRGCCLGH